MVLVEGVDADVSVTHGLESTSDECRADERENDTSIPHGVFS